jgi:formate dehydrogenase gamma subunit
LTGLNITFGQFLMMPLIGPDNFGVVSQIAKYVHNFTSFAFVIGMVLIIAAWIRDNLPRRVDIEWFKVGGGFIKSKHAPAGRFNAGEKLVFWLALAGGVAVIVSGYLLMFPFYVTNIFGMQIAQGVHAVIALLFIALILGHIYIGTVGMEGAFEAMGQGTELGKGAPQSLAGTGGTRQSRATSTAIRNANARWPSGSAPSWSRKAAINHLQWSSVALIGRRESPAHSQRT